VLLINFRFAFYLYLYIYVPVHILYNYSSFCVAYILHIFLSTDALIIFIYSFWMPNPLLTFLSFRFTAYLYIYIKVPVHILNNFSSFCVAYKFSFCFLSLYIHICTSAHTLYLFFLLCCLYIIYFKPFQTCCYSSISNFSILTFRLFYPFKHPILLGLNRYQTCFD
jgi:hypothetical protein